MFAEIFTLANNFPNIVIAKASIDTNHFALSLKIFRTSTMFRSIYFENFKEPFALPKSLTGIKFNGFFVEINANEANMNLVEKIKHLYHF